MERAAAAGYLAAGHGGDDPAPLIPVRVDGKTVRGARNPDGSQVHRLAALACVPGVVAAQAGVGARACQVFCVSSGDFVSCLLVTVGDLG